MKATSKSCGTSTKRSSQRAPLTAKQICCEEMNGFTYKSQKILPRFNPPKRTEDCSDVFESAHASGDKNTFSNFLFVSCHVDAFAVVRRLREHCHHGRYRFEHVNGASIYILPTTTGLRSFA